MKKGFCFGVFFLSGRFVVVFLVLLFFAPVCALGEPGGESRNDAREREAVVQETIRVLENNRKMAREHFETARRMGLNGFERNRDINSCSERKLAIIIANPETSMPVIGADVYLTYKSKSQSGKNYSMTLHGTTGNIQISGAELHIINFDRRRASVSSHPIMMPGAVEFGVPADDLWVFVSAGAMVMTNHSNPSKPMRREYRTQLDMIDARAGCGTIVKTIYLDNSAHRV